MTESVTTNDVIKLIDEIIEKQSTQRVTKNVEDNIMTRSKKEIKIIEKFGGDEDRFTTETIMGRRGKKKKVLTESISDDSIIDKLEESKIESVSSIAHKMSTEIVDEIKEDVKEIYDKITENKYDIATEIINYAVFIIDIMNQLIMKFIAYANEKVFGDNNFMKSVVEYLNVYYQQFVDNIKNEIKKEIISEKEIINTWKKIKSVHSVDEKEKILNRYTKKYGLTSENIDVSKLTFDSFVNLSH